MKINEAKEKLPLDFITSFVSRGWDEIGNLKASIAAIKDTFSKTSEVEAILQDLLDAYLICVGRLEGHLDDKNYLELPDDKELKEAFDVNGTEDDEQFVPKSAKVATDLPNYDIEVEQEGNKVEIELEPKMTIGQKLDKTTDDFDPEFDPATPAPRKAAPAEPFDYYVDFDDIDVSDDELSPREQWLAGQH